MSPRNSGACVLNSRDMLRIPAIIGIAVFTLFQVKLCAAPLYQITDIGTFGRSIFVMNLNASGTVIGGGLDANGILKAFEWTRESGFQFLQAPGGTGTRLNDINAAGLIVGDFDIGGGSRAFLYDGNQYSLLPSLPNGYPNQGDHATSINSAGTIAGFGYGSGPSALQALTWPSGGGLPQSTGLCCFTEGLNDNGQMVGIVQDIQNIQYATIWNAGIPSTIPRLPGDGFNQTSAINNQGEVIGISGTLNSYRAYLYSGGVVSQIGIACASAPQPLDINDASEIVGSCGSFAALFQSGQVLDLNQLIPLSPGLQLTQARAINASGQIAVNGTINGVSHAFILTPVPEPGSALLLAGALLALAMFKGKRALSGRKSSVAYEVS